jgi:hypothetical protein
MQESVKIILDLAGEFINLKDRYKGDTPLLGACLQYGDGSDPDILDLLIRRGADVLERDLLTGDTCLHRLLINIRDRDPNERTTACLVILIRAGLGIFDKNFEGVTPWDLARSLCLVRRKVFEDALTECEIDSTGLYICGEECPTLDKKFNPIFFFFCDILALLLRQRFARDFRPKG